jgi:hypothetical protein
VKLRNLSFSRNERGDHVDFFFEIPIILPDAVSAVRHEHRASAKIAERITEWKMEIQREVGRLVG